MANWATDTSYCAYSNPDYDKLYEELKGEMDPEKRKDLIFQMQQILVDDAAVLIDGYYNSSMIYSKKLVLHISIQQITTGCQQKLLLQNKKSLRIVKLLNSYKQK